MSRIKTLVVISLSNGNEILSFPRFFINKLQKLSHEGFHHQQFLREKDFKFILLSQVLQWYLILSIPEQLTARLISTRLQRKEHKTKANTTRHFFPIF